MRDKANKPPACSDNLKKILLIHGRCNLENGTAKLAGISLAAMKSVGTVGASPRAV